MRITEVIDEISRSLALLKICSCSYNQEELKNVIFQNFSERTAIGKNNDNFSNFSSYYRKLFSSCLNLDKTYRDTTLVDYFYFFLQNFLSHTLASHLAYIKVFSLGSLDLIAPLADVAGNNIYLMNCEIYISGDYGKLLKLSRMAQSVFSDTLLPHNLTLLSIESCLAKQLRLKHRIGGVSIVLNDLEKIMDLLSLISWQVSNFCEVLVLGKRKSLESLKTELNLSTIKSRSFRVIFLGSQNIELDSIAYFVLEPT